MKQSTLSLVKGNKWLSLSLSLGESLPIGQCSYIKGEFVCNVTHNIASPTKYDSREWGITILSGAPYAFRMMNSVHKEIIVHELKGLIDESDIEGISIASAIAIVELLGGSAQEVATGEWRRMIKV
jgi:hypothetical protein